MSTIFILLQSKSISLISTKWRTPIRNIVYSCKRYLRTKRLIQVWRYPAWIVVVGAHAVWITLITARLHTTRKSLSLLADSIPNSLCIDVAKIHPTFSTFQVWESTPSKSSIEFKITLVRAARKSRKNRSVSRPKMKRRGKGRFLLKNKKNFLKVPGEKNRKDCKGRLSSPIITSNTPTITTTNNNGKVGITNSPQMVVAPLIGSMSIPNRLSSMMIMPRKCGDKKWPSTSKLRGRPKSLCGCYVAFVKTNTTRICAWEFLSRKSVWRISTGILIYPN